MISVWSEKNELPRFDMLKGNAETDVLIIGGGITGLLTAYELEQSGVDYMLVEADRICGGITKNTTAKITSQHGLIYAKLIERFGANKARMYLEANCRAVEKYRELCRNIDCDFENTSSYVYSTDDLAVLEAEIAALDRISFKAELCKTPSLPFETVGAVKFNNQAQFDPLKFLKNISGKLKIYEHTRVRELKNTVAVCDGGNIRARKVIVTTHFPFINKHGSYFLKMYQQRSYVIGIKCKDRLEGAYISEKENGISLRGYKDLILIGGGGHRTGQEGGNWKELRDFAARYYPNGREKYAWATQDCMTLDAVPYIGNYSASTSDMYVASGFNKWGMTSAMVAAAVLCNMVQDKEDPYAEIFSPSRTMLRKQLAVNGFEAVKNMLTPTVPRCPHLGCALKWNEHERSWDCPCHGSRFSEHGALIDNPATGDLKKLREEE